ncbi:hypothetical protein QBC39DRAFT_396516 [Podospora conica]|nr:hypothetical protein QBC39DRAFT_396516 [Schizothecium conicum]
MSTPTPTPDALSRVPTAVLDLLQSKDLSPAALSQILHDIGASPSKLRALLNLWFVPTFRPTFIPSLPSDHHTSGLADVEIPAPSAAATTQTPYRMFDLATGNLVSYPVVGGGAGGQYCMLSHRWKGVELLLGDIGRARAGDLERAKAEAARGAVGGGLRGNDVQLVLEQCRIEVEEQEGVVRWLGSGTADGDDVERLLDRRLVAKAVEGGLEWARGEADEARTRLRFAEMESEVFEELVGKARDEGGKSQTAGQSSKVVDKMKTSVEDAAAKLEAARAKFAATEEEIVFFRTHSRLRDALDELVNRLQRWKSAIKLDEAMKECDRIFKTKLFQARERCYFWTDTCCIDKTNAGELSESLSLMGDWYANAEFTLVQLDTASSDADAVWDWRRFKSSTRDDEPLAAATGWGEKKKVAGYEDIAESKPEWSDRAWTLQELVMSKVTYYVNSKWEPLSRPVEGLGHLYHLIPFISFYTQRDTNNVYTRASTPMDGQILQDVLVGHDLPVELKGIRGHTNPPSGANTETILDKTKRELVRVDTAQQLIMVLDGIGVRFPKDMALETATSEMARVVYLAAADLASGSAEESCLRLFERLKDRLAAPTDAASRKEKEKQAQHIINYLLKCLVDETLDLILDDREYIAQFGQIKELNAWKQGKRRTGFAASSVLAVSGKRKATVATDRAYSLMGILDVRYPTFPAEGYAMALARLLDQVVISHSDITVFNWSGMEMGSPIRGRSLYPSTHLAYSNSDDQGSLHYNKLLSSQVQKKMNDVMKTYHGLINVLRKAIDAVKDKQQKDLPFGWLVQIIELIRISEFHSLQSELDSISKITGYVLKNCIKTVRPPEKVEGAITETVEESNKSMFSLPSLPSPSLSMPSPSLSMPSFKMGFGGGKKEDPPADTTKKASRLSSFGKTPSFGFGKTPTPVPVPETKPAPPPPPPATAPAPPAEPLPAKLTWQTHDAAVTAHLNHLTTLASTTSPTPTPTESNPPPLPTEILTTDLSILTDPAPTPNHPHTPGHHPSITHHDDTSLTTSPNPITLSTSGISAQFDIQRLRARVTRAVTPRDRVSGWCSISTGFARVVASFACETRALAQELDAVEGVETRVLREGGRAGTRGGRMLGGMVGAVTEEGGEGEHTSEERLVTRMIGFIQEREVGLVAGEWVLARFSGVPGAKWFLCHLELGAGKGELYGHRIASSDLDFGNSTPEPGLVKAWQTYMERKKRKMCYVLDRYLKSRMSAKESEERLSFGMKTVGEASKYMPDGFGFPGGGGAAKKVADEEATLVDDDGSDDEEEGVSMLDELLDKSKVAARAFGEFAMMAGVEAFFERSAQSLEASLNTSVLKKTPQKLRTAVEHMNENRGSGFLPAMYHASTTVLMM